MKLKRSQVGWLAALWLVALPSALAKNVEHRPHIGLVLGGGGAKGAAHVGVLQALEEMRVPVDYIAGTSMGAYVGGLYALGLKADEIHQLMNNIKWEQGYNDSVAREQKRVRDKAHQDSYNISTKFGFDLKQLKTPQGIVQGQNMIKMLRDSTGNLPSFHSFNQLAIPYRAVATDIEQLQPVILSEGQLTEAMLASMAVPGALPPVEINGDYLVDGGPVNNMPVNVAKEMGADVVIAVDISTDYSPAANLDSYISVMNQLVNFMVRNSTAQQIANLTPQDILLTPEVGDMETTEFNRMREAYQKGYEAAYRLRNKLKKHQLSPEAYLAYQQQKRLWHAQLGDTDQLFVDQIVINNQTKLSDAVLTKRLALKEGMVEKAELERAVHNLYVLDRFETVRYHIEERDEKNVLVVDVKEKSWGPNFVDFRFALEDNFASSSDFSLGLGINTTGLSNYGAELRTLLEIGSNKRAHVALYYPFTADQQFFTELQAGIKLLEKDEFYRSSEPTLDSVAFTLGARYRETLFDFGLGWQPHLWGEFKAGMRVIYGAENLAGGLFTQDYRRQMPYLSYKFDTLDSKTFPSRGGYFNFSVGYAQDEVNSNYGAYHSEAVATKLNSLYATSWGRHTLYGKLNFGLINEKLGNVVIEPNELGGFLNLSGIPKGSLWANNIAFGALVYRYRLLDNDFGLFESPLYLGASLEYGGVWNNPDVRFSDIPFYMAGSVFVGVDSPLGPLALAYGRTENNLDSLYFILGASF